MTLSNMLCQRHFAPDIAKLQPYIDISRSKLQNTQMRREARTAMASMTPMGLLLGTANGSAGFHVQTASGRPRLQDRLQLSTQDKIALDDTHGTWETFDAFRRHHSFSNTLSEKAILRVYFLASQTTWDWTVYVETVLGHKDELSEKVKKYPVTRPDLPVIQRCIDTFFMDGAAPFPELMAFKTSCFKSFPVTLFMKMNLCIFLRLYVCVYQNPLYWKQLWEQYIGLLSPSIIRDCELFVKETPFAQDAFGRFLCL
jgi:hypothetical protein